MSFKFQSNGLEYDKSLVPFNDLFMVPDFVDKSFLWKKEPILMIGTTIEPTYPEAIHSKCQLVGNIDELEQLKWSKNGVFLVNTFGQEEHTQIRFYLFVDVIGSRYSDLCEKL